MGFPRRKVTEIIAIYALERDVRDVFVEGPTDKSLMRWFLDSKGLLGVAVYEVDDIDLAAAGSAGGSRGRLLALARALEHGSGDSLPQPVCVVDRDLDDFVGASELGPYVLRTDYTSMEMYACNEPSMEKFLRLYCRKTSLQHEGVLSQVLSITRVLFAMRVARARLGIDCRWPPIKRSLGADEGCIRLDFSGFTNRLLSAGHGARRREFQKVADSVAGELVGDPRHETHGHDFVAVLAYFLRKRLGVHEAFSESAVARALVLCLDASTIGNEPLFASLALRARLPS